MTRFNISLEDGIEMVLWALEKALGGEILVPKIPSYRIIDVAEAIGPSCKKEIVGIRPGEKLHEEMITESDSHSTLDLGPYYAILPTGDVKIYERYVNSGMAKPVPASFKFDSGTNSAFLTISQIRNLIVNNIQSDFSPI
jgi:FlaA1/EpsC-like NDP-sugar epimerase